MAIHGSLSGRCFCFKCSCRLACPERQAASIFRNTDAPYGCRCRWSAGHLRSAGQADTRHPTPCALLNRAAREIVGYLIDEHGHAILQGPHDPFPGYYISQTAFTDLENHNERDPRRYVDARNINYVVRGDVARRRGVKVGDYASVYSKSTRKSVFAIVGDTGNPTGDEGSLHSLQNLGYPFHDGKSDSVERPEIIIRFYPNSNPKHQFFFIQSELDEAATKLGLRRDFTATPGTNR